jgi:hypothetical protein
MQIAHDRDTFDDLFALELEHEPEHAVGGGVLRAHVEDELLGLEPFVALDDRQRDLGSVLDGGTLPVDGGQGLTRP